MDEQERIEAIKDVLFYYRCGRYPDEVAISALNALGGKKENIDLPDGTKGSANG